MENTMGASVEQLLKDDGQPYKAAVLIPTINNADELDIVLERLSKQTYPHFEIVISDSKSKDHTKEVCEKYGATWIDDSSNNRSVSRAVLSPRVPRHFLDDSFGSSFHTVIYLVCTDYHRRRRAKLQSTLFRKRIRHNL